MQCRQQHSGSGGAILSNNNGNNVMVNRPGGNWGGERLRWRRRLWWWRLLGRRRLGRRVITGGGYGYARPWGGGEHDVNNFYGSGAGRGRTGGTGTTARITVSWAGFGTAAIASWGLNALSYPGYAYSSYGSYPSAWAAPVYDSWGISSVADEWMNSGYANPYATGASQTVVIQQPPTVVAGADAAAAPTQTVAYDYSNPISTVTPPEPTAAESAQKVFEAARDSFKAGDSARALSLADQALVQLPNDPTIHEFRAQCLIAARRYDEAAAAIYAVLSNGPGWDWATLINLYPSIDVYTNQLRALEAYAKEKPDSASGQFLLGYLYMVQGDKPAAAARFATVARLQPQDKLPEQLARTLMPDEQQKKVQQTLAAETTPGPPATADQPAATAAAATQAPNPRPRRSLVGTWTAKPDAKVTITLTLAADGNFSWAVTQAKRTQTIQGQAGFQDDVLVLGQGSRPGPPLTGKIQQDPAGGGFTFKPPGSPDKVAGLNFTKE